MARSFDGISDRLSTNTKYFSAHAGAFAAVAWIKPYELPGASTQYVAMSGTISGNFWGIRWAGVSNSVDFVQQGGSGTSLTTASSLPLSSVDVSNGCRVGWRYNGAGGAWEKWIARGNNGLAAVTRTTINAALTYTFPTLSVGSTSIGSNSTSGSFFKGTLAEIYLINVAISDDQMQALMRGISPDQVMGGWSRLLAAWPLNGSGNTEPDYTGLPSLSGGAPLTIGGVCEPARHPPRYAADVIVPTLAEQVSAITLDIVHPDEGTIRVASADLTDLVDADMLGAPYPGGILNGGQIRPAKSLRQALSMAPSPTTIICERPARRGIVRRFAECLLDDEPVLYLRMGDEGTDPSGNTVNAIVDSSGRRLSALVTGASSMTFGAAGALYRDPNKAITFPADIGAYITIPAVDSLNLTTELSIGCFIKFASSSGSFGILEKTINGVGDKQWMLFTSGTTLYFRGYRAGLAFTASYDLTSLPTASFIQVDAIFDGSSMRLYVDKILRATTVVGGPLDGGSGITYVGRIANTSYPMGGTIDELAICNYALTTDQIYRRNAIATAGPREWRGVPAIVRRYIRGCERVTELSGLIVDFDFSIPGQVAWHISDRQDALWSKLIPARTINVDEHPFASDLGAAIPVVYGNAFVGCPVIGHQSDGSPGGLDLAVSHLFDCDNAEMTIRPRALWFDEAITTPDLEIAGEWAPAPGSPTLVSSTVFSVSSALSDRYHVTAYGGLPIRFKTTGSAGSYLYSFITAYDLATNRVTIKDPLLASGLTSVELNYQWLVEIGRYTSGGKSLLTIRIPGVDQLSGGVVVNAVNSSISNPAIVFRDLVANPVYGLGKPVNSGLATQAAADFSDAGLGSACNYAPAHDRQQSEARTLAWQLLGMRGGWCTWNGETEEFDVYVDKPGVRPWRTIGWADVFNENVKRVSRDSQTPFDQMVRTLNLRYGTRYRVKGNSDVGYSLATNDFEHSIFCDVLSVGKDVVETNPWIRRYADAAKVLSYGAQRMRIEDGEKGLVLEGSLRNLQVGELVQAQFAPLRDDGTYRVIATQSGLAEGAPSMVAYDDSMFDPATITFEHDDGSNTQNDVSNALQSVRTAGTGINYIRNAGFEIAARRASSGSSSSYEPFVLPGWAVSDQSSRLSVFKVTADPDIIGGAYLTLTVAGSGVVPMIRTNGDLAARYLPRVVPVRRYEVVCFSFYCDQPTGWNASVLFHDTNGSTLETITGIEIRCDPNETNARGWPRYYVLARATVANSATAVLNLAFPANGTYRLAAFQGERLAKGVTRPSAWRPGMGGELELYAEEEITVPSSGSATITSSTGSKLLRAGMDLRDVAPIVTQALGGTLTGVNIGPTGGTANLYASGLGKTLGTRTTAIETNAGFVPGTGIAADNTLSLAPVGGNWGGGKIKVQIRYSISRIPTT